MGCGGSTPAADSSPDTPKAAETKTAESAPKSAPKEEKKEEKPSEPAAPPAPTDAVKGKLLSAVPLLQNFTEEQLNLLGGACEEMTFSDTEAVFKQGDPGERFYIITDGKAAVTAADADGKAKIIGQLGEGDYFGETALQNDAPRGASIIASGGELKVFSLTKEKFSSLIGGGVQFVSRRIGISAEANPSSGAPEVADAIDSHLAPPNADREKPGEVQELIFNTVQNSMLFTGLSEDHINAVIHEMYRHEVEVGVSPIKQGDPGNNLFVVESGSFDVHVSGVNDKVATRGPGEIFGELALLYNAPRAATVTATSPSVVWKVDRYTFRRIARDVGEGKMKERIQFLSKVDLLSALTSLERSKIAEALDDVSFDAGTTVFSKGDIGDAMYIIKTGKVVVTLPGEDDEAADQQLQLEAAPPKRGSIVVNSAEARDYFGERALLTDETRAAKVRCVTGVQALCLKRHDFKLLLGPLTSIMEKRIDTYGKTEMTDEKNKEEDEEEGVKLEDIQFTDLQTIGTLGKGSFGHVQLVQHKETEVCYALKTVNKQQIVDTHQQEHIVSEKNVMIRMNHPNLIRLFQTYKDDNSLYFLLEPVMGGELFSLLRRRRLFKESTAKFYAANVACAFEYLHNKDTVYRDLKPENLLLDNMGYIKITDFGFAKRIGNGKTWTLCGTPDYLAPEIVSGRGHGKGVDWWTLGVLIYEMIASYTPFYHQNQLKMYDKIVRGKYRFPSHFSRSAKLVVSELLEHKPTKRLGVIAGGAKVIKQHEWFEGFDWKALDARTLTAPIPVKIKSTTDLSNFDVYDDDQHERVRPYKDDGSNWDANF